MGLNGYAGQALGCEELSGKQKREVLGSEVTNHAIVGRDDGRGEIALGFL